MLENETGRKMQRTATVVLVLIAVCALAMAVSLGSTIYSWVFIYGLYDMRLAPNFWVSGICSALETVAMLFVFVQAVWLLGAFRRRETPFHAKNVRRLKAMAFTLLGAACLGLAGTLAGRVFTPAVHYYGGEIARRFNSLEFFLTGYGFSTNLSILMEPVLLLTIALVIYCVALVFDYGVSLQTQSDETL